MDDQRLNSFVQLCRFVDGKRERLCTVRRS